jgi:hypothetical protein
MTKPNAAKNFLANERERHKAAALRSLRTLINEAQYHIQHIEDDRPTFCEGLGQYLALAVLRASAWEATKRALEILEGEEESKPPKVLDK